MNEERKAKSEEFKFVLQLKDVYHPFAVNCNSNSSLFAFHYSFPVELIVSPPTSRPSRP